MENPSSLILSRMLAASHAMDVVANNIANASTPGYKSLHLGSASWLDRLDNAGAPQGGETIEYATSSGTWRDASAGAIKETNNPLDFALSGPGFFTVQTQQGTRLTRDGRFTLSADGRLTTSSGEDVLDSSGQPISISQAQGSISVASDGTITNAGGVIGQLGIVQVKNEQSLVAEGSNLFAAPDGWSSAQKIKVIQGALEGSNVKPIIEITDMLKVSQNFQMISQFLSSEQTRHENAISKILSSN